MLMQTSSLRSASRKSMRDRLSWRSAGDRDLIVDRDISNAVRLARRPAPVPSADITVADTPASPAMSFRIAGSLPPPFQRTGSSLMWANASVGKASSVLGVRRVHLERRRRHGRLEAEGWLESRQLPLRRWRISRLLLTLRSGPVSSTTFAQRDPGRRKPHRGRPPRSRVAPFSRVGRPSGAAPFLVASAGGPCLGITFGEKAAYVPVDRVESKIALPVIRAPTTKINVAR